jgi:hypothetical protein
VNAASAIQCCRGELWPPILRKASGRWLWAPFATRCDSAEPRFMTDLTALDGRYPLYTADQPSQREVASMWTCLVNSGSAPLSGGELYQHQGDAYG